VSRKRENTPKPVASSLFGILLFKRHVLAVFTSTRSGKPMVGLVWIMDLVGVIEAWLRPCWCELDQEKRTVRCKLTGRTS